MKKFIMTAIVICLSIATAIPFHSTKAMSQALIERNVQIADNNGNYIGWFNNYAYLTTGTEYITTSYFGVSSYSTYKTVSVLTFGFDTYYTGEIKILFEGSLSNFQMCIIQGDQTGQYRWSGSNKVVYVSFENCLQFNVILLSNTQYTASNIPAKTSSITFESLFIGNPGGSNGSGLPSYQVPLDSISAYQFTEYVLDDVQYAYGDIYPYLHINYANPNQNRTKEYVFDRYGMGADNPTYYVFMTDKDLLTNQSYMSGSLSNSTYTIQELRHIDGWYTYQVQMYNTSYGSSGSIHFGWNTDMNIIPIFLGFASQCPENLKNICGIPGISYDIHNIAIDTTTISNYIVYIYNLLAANAGDQGQTSQDIGDLADDFGDIADQEHNISSGFQGDLDDFNETVDLQDYDFLTGIANASEYFKIQLENVFNNSVNLRAMWVLPVICIVLLRLLGG